MTISWIRPVFQLFVDGTKEEVTDDRFVAENRAHGVGDFRDAAPSQLLIQTDEKENPKNSGGVPMGQRFRVDGIRDVDEFS